MPPARRETFWQRPRVILPSVRAGPSPLMVAMLFFGPIVMVPIHSVRFYYVIYRRFPHRVGISGWGAVRALRLGTASRSAMAMPFLERQLDPLQVAHLLPASIWSGPQLTQAMAILPCVPRTLSQALVALLLIWALQQLMPAPGKLILM